MNRRTTELILPESKAKIVLYEFLTGGDFRAIQKKLLESTNVNIQDPKNIKVPSNIPGSVILDGEDMTVKLLIKSVTSADGPETIDIDKFVYNLSIKDSDALFEKVRQLSNASNLSLKAKKK